MEKTEINLTSSKKSPAPQIEFNLTNQILTEEPSKNKYLAQRDRR